MINKHASIGLLFVASALLTACGSLRSQQTAGTDFINGDRNGKVATYVTPQEYDRMSEAERKRWNAQVGASVIWTSMKQAADVSTAELEKARRTDTGK